MLFRSIVIEQAKGVLSERANLNMEQSFGLLRSHARNQNLRLVDVAQHVIDDTLSVEPGTYSLLATVPARPRVRISRPDRARALPRPARGRPEDGAALARAFRRRRVDAPRR